MSDGAAEIDGRLAVCSWSLQPRSPAGLIDALSQTGINTVSLALSPIVSEPQQWGGAIELLQGSGVAILSGMMTTLDEDYSTLQSIARTGGVRPDDTWLANLEHARAVADLAAGAGLSLVTLHAGFLPEDPDDPERAKIIGRIAQLADVFASRSVSMALETGQESARTLEDVLRELDRPNLGVNFDPANMILYGMGDPIAALRRLLPRVRQVHIKDAVASETPGQWGTEVPAGEGQVNWQAFFEVLSGSERPVDMVIERESGVRRIEDVRQAAALITGPR